MDRPFYRPLRALTVVLALLFAHPSQAELPAALAGALTKAKLPKSAVSLLVAPLDGGKPLASLNADQPRNPASTIKLVTSWAALDRLGPTYRWPTEVYALGPIDNEILKGDLLLRGHGDPFLVIEEFWKLLGELRRRGIREIRGDLLIDDSRFSPADQPAGAFDGKPHRLYNVPPSALLVNFQSIRFVFNPEAGTNRARIHTVPPLENLAVTSEVQLTKKRCKGSAPQIAMRFAAEDNPDHVVFSGVLPRTCKNYAVTRSAMTSRTYAYGVFTHLWSQWGGSIDGELRSARAPAAAKPLFVWRSRPLADSLRPLNKWSNNSMARALLRTIGAASVDGPVDRATAAQAMVTHLGDRGLDTRGLVVDNGAGLSRTARTSARFLVDLLQLAWREPTMPEFLASLSLAGRDGTTRRRYARAPFAGRMHLKTGQLDDVVAVAGYVHAKHGQRLAVALLINHPGAHRGRGSRLRDAVLDWTFKVGREP